jgi:hypothetical protein
MSRRSKDEANHDLQIADIMPLVALDERVAIVGAFGAVWRGQRASTDENLAEAALSAQLDAVPDLRDHVDDLAAAELPKGFGR